MVSVCPKLELVRMSFCFFALLFFIALVIDSQIS